MAKPNPQLEAALTQFAAQSGTTPDQAAQLRAAVVADTERLDVLNQQAATGAVANSTAARLCQDRRGSPRPCTTVDRSAWPHACSRSTAFAQLRGVSCSCLLHGSIPSKVGAS